MSKLIIPRKTVYRLSLYQRALNRLKANKLDTVSSAALAKAAGVKPTQLRKDLTYFGQFGTRGPSTRQEPRVPHPSQSHRDGWESTNLALQLFHVRTSRTCPSSNGRPASNRNSSRFPRRTL